MRGSFAHTSLALGLLEKPRAEPRNFCSAPSLQDIPYAMFTVTIYTFKYLKFQNLEYELVAQLVE